MKEYKDKLDGASPDEAKARLDAFEHRLEALEPRHLKANQQGAMRRLLDPLRGNLIIIGSDAASPAATQLARSFADIFRSSGWNVQMATMFGIGKAVPLGIALGVTDPSNLTMEQKAIESALRAAQCDYTITKVPERLAMPGVQMPAADLLLTAPS